MTGFRRESAPNGMAPGGTARCLPDRIDAKAQETDALVRSEAPKHRHALAQVITWVTLVVIYCGGRHVAGDHGADRRRRRGQTAEPAGPS